MFCRFSAIHWNLRNRILKHWLESSSSALKWKETQLFKYLTTYEKKKKKKKSRLSRLASAVHCVECWLKARIDSELIQFQSRMQLHCDSIKKKLRTWKVKSCNWIPLFLKLILNMDLHFTESVWKKKNVDANVSFFETLAIIG